MTSTYWPVEPRRSYFLPLGEFPKCPTKSLYFAPGKRRQDRDACSDCRCLRVAPGPCGPGRMMLGLPHREGPHGEPSWRLRFPARGVAISSCFLLIERSDNAMVTQLPASGMNNSRFVQGQLRSSGCTSHLLPGPQLEEAVAPCTVSLLAPCPKVPSWLG